MNIAAVFHLRIQPDKGKPMIVFCAARKSSRARSVMIFSSNCIHISMLGAAKEPSDKPVNVTVRSLFAKTHRKRRATFVGFEFSMQPAADDRTLSTLIMQINFNHLITIITFKLNRIRLIINSILVQFQIFFCVCHFLCSQIDSF